MAFRAFTKQQDSMPAGWLDAPDVSQWLRKRKFDVGDLRQRGGIIMRVAGRDAVAAVDAARERLERLAARVMAGSDREFRLLPKVWIDGELREFRLTRAGRGADVHASEGAAVPARLRNR